MPFIQLPTDAPNTGKKIDTVTPDGTQHREIVVIGSGSSTNTLAVNSSGEFSFSGTISASTQVTLGTNPTVLQGTNPWTIGGNSTVVQGTSPWIVESFMKASSAPSSASSGAIVRVVVDNILTTASSNAFASTALTIQSSAASLRSYVTAFSITSTVATPTAVKFMSGSTLIWPLVVQAVSSAVSGANLAVSAPGYLFRTKSAGALSLNVASSVAGFKVAVSYFRAG